MGTIYLFYGEDRYSSTQKLKFWQEEFLKKYGENSLEVFDGNKLNIPEFLTNLETLPFLSEKKMTVIKDFLAKGKDEESKQLAKNLEKTPEFCILIFFESEQPDKTNPVFKKIAKIGKLEEFKAPNINEISNWILERAKKENIKINFGTANYLGQYAGSDLWTISNELEKLKNFAEEKEISKEMIDEICIPSLSASIFKLTDDIAAKKEKNSLKTFEILRESGEDLIKVFFMIVRHFRILIQVSEMINKGENNFSITKRLKQHPFVIQKTSAQSKNFTIKKLEEIYEKLLEIDKKVKTGIIKSYKTDNREFHLAIEKLIIDCCN